MSARSHGRFRESTMSRTMRGSRHGVDRARSHARARRRQARRHASNR